MFVLRIEVFRHLTISHGLELAKEMIRDTDEADEGLCLKLPVTRTLMLTERLPGDQASWHTVQH